MYRQEIRLDVKRVILFSFSDRWLLIWNAGRFRSIPGRSRCEEKNLTFLLFLQSIRDGYIQKSRFINRSGVRKYRLMWIMQWPVRWNNYGRSWERIPKAHLISRQSGVWDINSVMGWSKRRNCIKNNTVLFWVLLFRWCLLTVFWNDSSIEEQEGKLVMRMCQSKKRKNDAVLHA